MVKDKKLKISEPVDTLSPGDLEGSLEYIRKTVDGLINTWGLETRLEFDAEYAQPYDEPRPMYIIHVLRDETDTEQRLRLDRAAMIAERLEAHERAELKRLQEKYKGK